MTKHQTEIEGVLDAVETSYFVTQILAGCNGKTAINAYNAAVDEFNSAVNRYYAIDAAKNDNGKKALHQAKISAEVTARIIIHRLCRRSEGRSARDHSRRVYLYSATACC